MTTDSSSIRNRAVAGSLSGCATRFFCQPLDVLKIRFQVQIEPLKKSHPGAVYNGITQAFMYIIKKEGIFALWKGHVAAQALSMTYGLFQFAAFGSLVKEIIKLVPQISPYRSVVDFSAGFGAGCLATVAAYPFDTIRTRLVVQGEPKVYKGMIDATLKMTAQEGYLSLYRGLWPTLLQIGPYSGCQFALYHMLVDAFKQFESEEHVGLRSLLCGAISGAAAKTIVYPLDLGKKRLQVKGFQPRHHYYGLWHCLVTTSKTEGLPALWKGLSPSLAKALLTSALHFYFYEIGLRLLSSKTH